MSTFFSTHINIKLNTVDLLYLKQTKALDIRYFHTTNSRKKLKITNLGLFLSEISSGNILALSDKIQKDKQIEQKRIVINKPISYSYDNHTKG